MQGRSGVAFRKSSRLIFFSWVCVAIPFLVSAARPSLADELGANGYKLSSGDKIAISVLGQQELSGDVVVDDAGNIQLLVVGQIKAAGLTVSEVKTEIIKVLTNGYLKLPVVNVRISQLRPIYILGTVRRSGEYAFRYGTTVKSLIATAGGLGLPDTEKASVAEFIAADERVNELLRNQLALSIKRARLETQRDGKKTFTLNGPENVAPNLKKSDLVDSENEALKTQFEIFQGQLAMLRAQKPRLDAQIEALNGELQSEAKQSELAQQQVDRYRKLSSEGLGRSTTLVEYNQTQARYESQKWRIVAELSRTRVVIGEIDLKIEEAEANYKRQVALDLESVRQRLHELEISIPSALGYRAAKLAQTGGVAAEADPKYSVQITRVADGIAKQSIGLPTTLLAPGDLVDIKMELLHASQLPPDVKRSIN